MKKFIGILCLFFSTAMFSNSDEVTTRYVLGDDPSAGVIYTLCIENYKFALYRNIRTVRNAEGYAGESQSSSLSQIIDSRGKGLKCSG